MANRWLCAVLIAAMMVAPALLFVPREAEAVSFVRQITTLGDGSAEHTLIFPTSGTDNSLFIRIPNGSTILSATLNITGDAYVSGGKDYPDNVSLDVGEDGELEYVFDGKGYGRLGHQYLISNTTNSTEYLRVPFFSPGTFDSIRIRLPKDANVTRATVKLEGSKGAGPANISTVTQMQAWAPGQWVTQGSSIMVDELNGNTLYDMMQFDLTSIPNTAFVSNATFWWARAGTSPYDYLWHYSFADPLGAYQILEAWNIPTTKVLKETFPPESTNIMTNNQTFYSWNITRMTESWVEGERPNNGVCIHRTVAADRDKWDYSLKPYLWLQYGSPGNVSLVLNDTAPSTLYSQSGTFDTTVTVNDFSAKLNSYLGSHPADPALTDAYGNDFVEIPFTINSSDIGRVNISTIDIAYKLDAVVNENPGTGNLTNALNELVSKVVDGGNTDIPLVISTNHTGKVKVSGIRIEFVPPDHFPTIDAHTPDSFSVTMNENETMDLNITASDMYKYPLNVSWYMNGKLRLYEYYNMSYYADFESAGKYCITVVVNNGLHDVSATWNLTVKNVNRGPIINSSFPPEKPVMKENATLQFIVNATDPDRDALRYAWTVNGDDRSVNAPTFNFTTDFSSAGIYDVRCAAMDPGSLSVTMSWRLTVQNVNVAPRIDTYNPKNNARIKETEAITFSVMASDYDKQPLSYKWYLNGTEVGYNTQYTFRSNFDSAGNYTVGVVVSDGDLNDSHTWALIVDNVNRLPMLSLDRPKDVLEFMDTDTVNFSALSSTDPDGDTIRFFWNESGKTLSTSAEFDMKFPPGEHEVTLEINDGNGGFNSSGVRFVVHFIKLSANLTVDNQKITEGDEVTLTATVENSGDARASPVVLELLVDNRSVERKTIEYIEGYGTDKATFTWKAVKGYHTFTLRIEEQNWSTSASVQARLIPGIAGGSDTLFVLGHILMILGVTIPLGVFAYTRRKKARREAMLAAAIPSASTSLARSGRQRPRPDGRLESDAGVPLGTPPVQYEPIASQPSAPAPGYPPASTYVPPPPPPPQAPPQQLPAGGPTALSGAAISEEREARDVLAITESMLQDYERKGKGSEQVRQMVRLARHFYERGAFLKSISYCEKAESYMK